MDTDAMSLKSSITKPRATPWGGRANTDLYIKLSTNVKSTPYVFAKRVPRMETGREFIHNRLGVLISTLYGELIPDQPHLTNNSDVPDGRFLSRCCGVLALVLAGESVAWGRRRMIPPAGNRCLIAGFSRNQWNHKWLQPPVRKVCKG